MCVLVIGTFFYAESSIDRHVHDFVAALDRRRFFVLILFAVSILPDKFPGLQASKDLSFDGEDVQDAVSERGSVLTGMRTC